MGEAFITRRGGGNIIQWEIISSGSSGVTTLYHTLPDISHAYGAKSENNSFSQSSNNLNFVVDKRGMGYYGSGTMSMTLSNYGPEYGADGSITAPIVGSSQQRFTNFSMLCLYDESEGSLV